MFRTLLGKKCMENPECALAGQMQDGGLPICPECTGALTPVTRINRRVVIAVTAVGLLLTGTSSVFGYGLLVKRFTAAQTMRWLTGNLKRVDRLGFGADQRLTGTLNWWNADGKGREQPAQYVYERVNSQHRFRPAFTAERDDRLRFELSSTVPYAYVLYRAPDQPVLLFPAQSSESTRGAASIRVPAGATQAIRLAGPAATEHFVLVASSNPVPVLDRMRERQSVVSGPQIDQVIGDLERDAENAVVYHVMVPHK